MRLILSLVAVSMTTACAAQQPELAPLAGPDGQVRLRCGSDALKARIRAEGVEVERRDGSRVIVPPQQAPGDGAAFKSDEFTFYKVRGTGGWQVEARDGGRMACTHESTSPAP